MLNVRLFWNGSVKRARKGTEWKAEVRAREARLLVVNEKTRTTAFSLLRYDALILYGVFFWKRSRRTASVLVTSVSFLLLLSSTPTYRRKDGRTPPARMPASSDDDDATPPAHYCYDDDPNAEVRAEICGAALTSKLAMQSADNIPEGPGSTDSRQASNCVLILGKKQAK